MRLTPRATLAPPLLARPPLDAVGQNVMNFSYRAVDGGTGSISTAATVLISTVAVNDPPVPSNVTLVAEAGAARLITLLGTDVDDPIATARAVLDGPISPDVSIILNATARTVSYLYEGPVTTDTMDPPYVPTEDWQLPLTGAGARVKVRQIHEDGWAEVRDATGTTGLVPVCYLDLPPPPPVQ